MRAEQQFGLFLAECERGVRPDARTDGGSSPVSGLTVPLESIGSCFQGVIPSWLTTCSAEGVPNATIISIVRYVDADSVALTRQFFNKTRANPKRTRRPTSSSSIPEAATSSRSTFATFEPRARGRPSTRSRRT